MHKIGLISLAAVGISGATVIAATPSTPAGNAATGAKLFLQCRACHTVGAMPSTIGPNLNGVVGSKAGSAPKYTYSPAMAKSGLVWNWATLDKFLIKPTAVVPGTKMTFSGVAAPQARADIIAYLATQKGPRR